MSSPAHSSSARSASTSSSFSTSSSSAAHDQNTNTNGELTPTRHFSILTEASPTSPTHSNSFLGAPTSPIPQSSPLQGRTFQDVDNEDDNLMSLRAGSEIGVNIRSNLEYKLANSNKWQTGKYLTSNISLFGFENWLLPPTNVTEWTLVHA